MRYLILLSLLASATFLQCNPGRSSMPVEIAKSREITAAVTESDECRFSLDIRYVVVRNEAISESSRHVEIFLDPKEYSEERLKLLFQTFSKWYPAPDRLVIVIYTRWEQISRISSSPNCPGIGSTKAETDDHDLDYSAYFSRRGPDQYFSFYTDSEQGQKMKKVVINQ